MMAAAAQLSSSNVRPRKMTYTQCLDLAFRLEKIYKAKSTPIGNPMPYLKAIIEHLKMGNVDFAQVIADGLHQEISMPQHDDVRALLSEELFRGVDDAPACYQ